MKIVLFGFLIMLMPIVASARYIIYDSDGKILGMNTDGLHEKGQSAISYNGELFNIPEKKIVNGQIVDREEYGRKIEISGDTEVTAAPNVAINLTLKLADRNGIVLTNLDREIQLKVTRGKLTKKKVTPVNGVLSFTIKGVDETIDIELTATDLDGVFQSGKHTISLIP